MEDQEITREEWEQAGDDRWRGILNAQWAEPYVSLSAAVWWIATGGEATECDDDALESAKETLLSQVRSKEARLEILGRQKTETSPRQVVGPHELSDALSFFGLDDEPSLSRFFSGAPCLHWNPMLETGRRDDIAKKDGSLSWCDLAIQREDMLRFWPATKVEASEPANETLAQVAAAIDVTDTEPARVDAIAHEHSAASVFPAPVTKPLEIAAYLIAKFPVKQSHTLDELTRMIRGSGNNFPDFRRRTLSTAIAIAYGDNPKFAEMRKIAQDYAKERKFK